MKCSCKNDKDGFLLDIFLKKAASLTAE